MTKRGGNNEENHEIESLLQSQEVWKHTSSQTIDERTYEYYSSILSARHYFLLEDVAALFHSETNIPLHGEHEEKPENSSFETQSENGEKLDQPSDPNGNTLVRGNFLSFQLRPCFSQDFH